MAEYSSAFNKWYQKHETKAQLASAKKNAWEQFTKQFPNADKDQFYVQTSVDEKYKISAEVFSEKGSSIHPACLDQTESIGAKKRRLPLV